MSVDMNVQAKKLAKDIAYNILDAKMKASGEKPLKEDIRSAAEKGASSAEGVFSGSAVSAKILIADLERGLTQFMADGRILEDTVLFSVSFRQSVI